MKRIAVAVVLAAAVGALALLLAAWPVTVVICAIVLAGLAVALRAPALALALGLLLLGFEGSIKVLLGLDSTPLPGSPRAAGAAVIDLVLFAGVAGVLVRDRGATPRAIWRSCGRAERALIGLLVAWFAVSVLQTAEGGHLKRGIEDFRVFQAYVLVGVAAAVVAAAPGLLRRAGPVLLLLGLAVGGYAAFRVVTGPAPAEKAAAVSVHGTTTYGRVDRAIGSFSGAVGLVSYLVPLALFALVLGFLVPRLRRWAWPVAALAVAPLAASFARSALVGIVLALLFMLAILLSAADLSLRRKLATAGAVVVALAGMYGAIAVASQETPRLRERVHGILHPFTDPAMKIRYDNWKLRVKEVEHHPFGEGVGTIGGSSRPAGAPVGTTDNSFLKVFVDQGIAVGLAFLVAVVGLVVVLGRRLRRRTRTARAVGLAALTGFVGFLGLGLTGETVEQPGKAIAWAMLGIAVAQALQPAAPVAALAGSGLPLPRDEPRPRRRVWIAAAVVVAIVPLALTLGRGSGSEASVELIPHRHGQVPAVIDPGWYRQFTALPGFQIALERASGVTASAAELRSVRFDRTAHGIRLSVRRGGSPGESGRFVQALAIRIADFARMRLRIAAFLAGKPYYDRLKHGRLAPAKARQLRARLAQLSAFVRKPLPLVAVGRVTTTATKRWGDRVLDVLPGTRGGRPSAFWVVIAGLLATLTLWVGALVLGPIGRRPRPRQPRRGARMRARRSGRPIRA